MHAIPSGSFDARAARAASRATSHCPWVRPFASLLRPFAIVDQMGALFMVAWNTPGHYAYFCREALVSGRRERPLIRAAADFYRKADELSKKRLVYDALNHLRSPFAWSYYHRQQRIDPKFELPFPRFPLDRSAWRTSQVFNFAAGCCELDFLQFLQEHGADVTNRGALNQTALHQLMDAHRFTDDIEPIIEWLLECGVAIDAQDHFGRTALHIAAQRGSTRGCQALLIRDADASILDKEGFSAASSLPSIGYTQLKAEIGAGALTRALKSVSSLQRTRPRI